MIRRLINIIVLFKEYIVLGVIVIISFALIALSASPTVQPLRAVTTVVVGTLQSALGWIPNPFVMKESQEELRQRNIELSAELAKLRRSKAENAELRRLLNLKPRPDFKLLSAEIVGKTSSPERNLMTLDRGMSDGVRVGMAVMTDAGLIGRVFAASDGYSLVESLYNTTIKIAAKVERSRVDGIIGWEEGAELLMRNVPKALDVEVGDKIVTSEYSIYFPSDVPIGTVVKLENEPNSLFRRIIVMPEALPDRVEHCFVVLTATPHLLERLKLEESIDKPERKVK